MFLIAFTTPTIKIEHIKANKQIEKPSKKSNWILNSQILPQYVKI